LPREKPKASAATNDLRSRTRTECAACILLRMAAAFGKPQRVEEGATGPPPRNPDMDPEKRPRQLGNRRSRRLRRTNTCQKNIEAPLPGGPGNEASTGGTRGMTSRSNTIPAELQIVCPLPDSCTHLCRGTVPTCKNWSKGPAAKAWPARCRS
jgi:hypothetical protein